MVGTDSRNMDGGERGRVSRGWWRISLARDFWFDVMALAGVILLAVGLWMIYPPVAFVVVGFLLLLGAVLGARGTNRSESDGRE